MAVRFQLRRDTAANWASTNPVLALGEPGVETDTLKLKVGDGSTAWNSLSYSISLDFNDLNSTPTTLAGYGITDALSLTQLSVTQNAASGTGALTYNNTTGVFEYTPPDFAGLTGNFTGSVFADDSSVMIDGVAGKVLGDVENTNTTTTNLFASTIDTTDSSAITITPDVIMSAGLTVGNHIIPSSNVNIDLGSATNRFRDLYLSGETINLGGAIITKGAGNTIQLPVGTTLGGVKAPDQTLDTTDDATFNSVTGNIFTSLIDSADSSAITITPDVVMSAGLTVGNHIVPSSSENIDLGSASARFRDLYLSGNSAIIGDLALKRHTSGGLLVSDHSTGNATNITTHNITANNITAAGDVDVTGNLTMTGYIAGPATFVIDPAAVGDDTGTVVIAGGLQVDGTTTTINSTTVNVDDLNIQLATGAINAAAANGAGITVDGASATITYDGTNDLWSFNKELQIDPGYITLGTSVGTDNSWINSVEDGNLELVVEGRASDAGGIRLNRYNNPAGDTTYFRDLYVYDGKAGEVLHVDGSTKRVGIGAFDPSYLLDAQTSSGNAQFRLKSGGDLAQIILESTDLTGNSQINFADADSNNIGMLQYFHSDNHMEFTVNSAEAMRINSDGQVGIGGIDPTRNLVVSGTGGVLVSIVSTDDDNCQLMFGDSASDTIGKVLYRHADDRLSLQAGGSEAVHIVGNKVGIGPNANTPAATLDIQEETALTNSVRDFLKLTHNTSNTSVPGFGSAIYFVAERNNGVLQAQGRIGYDAEVNAGTDISSGFFVTTATAGVSSEKFRVTHDGKVGIGTDSPTSKLTVDSGIGSSSTTVIDILQSTNGIDKQVAGIGVLVDNGGESTNAGGMFFQTASGGSLTERMRLTSSGGLELGYNGATRQQADSQALSIITPATGGGQGIALKRLDSNTDQGLGEISWSNNTQDGLANIRVKTDGAVNTTDMLFETSSAGSLISAIKIDGSREGNVGIGPVDPLARLHVDRATSDNAQRTIYADGTHDAITTNGTNYLHNVWIENHNFDIDSGVTDSGYRIGLNIEGYHDSNVFEGTLATQKNIWSRNGNNSGGTGTITNSYNLHLETLSGGGMTITNNYGLYQTGTGTKNYFQGDVGIGTDSPTRELEIKNDAPTQNTGIKIHNNSASNAAILELEGARTSDGIDVSQLLTANSGNNITNIRTQRRGVDGGEITFMTSAAGSGDNMTQRMVIDENGYVGINVADPVDLFHIRRASGSDVGGEGHIILDVADDGGPKWAIRIGDTGDDGDFRIDSSLSSVWTNRVQIDRLSGDFYTNDGTVSSLSDSRVKKDIVDLEDGLSLVNQLRPVTFKYNGLAQMAPDDDRVNYGFIADEVQAVAPQYVTEKTEAINGETVEDFKTLSTGRMIPMLFKAVQELSAQVEALQAEINALKGE